MTKVTVTMQKATMPMSPISSWKPSKLTLLALASAVIVLAGCSSSLNTATTSSTGGPTFLVGTDAPLASVVSFNAQIESVELTPAPTSGSSNLLSAPTTVDFARYNGLQGLVDQNKVVAGTYTGVAITLGTATIGYLNVPTSGGEPTIATYNVDYTGSSPSTYTVSIPLSKPLTIVASNASTSTGPVGLRMDFDLSQSIANSGGQITLGSDGNAQVTPTFDVSTIARTDTGAHIDEFIGAVVTAPTTCTATACTFAIQGPHGKQFTIDTSSTTAWDDSATPSALTSCASGTGQTTTCVLAVAGQMDPAEQTLDADEVAILTTTNFYANGLVTYVASATSSSSELMDFYVRSVLPDSFQDVPLGNIAHVDISGKENYGIYWMRNSFAQMLFNSSSLTPGQEIAVGGTDTEASPSGAVGAPITVDRIHLQNWGYTGTINPKSQNSGQGSFQMTITGFAGTVVPTTVTVYLGGKCDYRYGFGAFNDLSDSVKVRVVGLLLKTSNGLVLVARHVDGFRFTDFSTFSANN